VDWKLELVVVPVSDVDRAKSFYADKVGFAVDVDTHVTDTFRVVQLTPPGSACSINIGTAFGGTPGAAQGLHLIVNDIEAAWAQLVERGVEAGEIVHFEDGQQVLGPDPARADYGSFVFFSDPDGNSWAVQEVGH
jgi:catechol 2,3-dioxygenase-like lactoylglutathione lyase family enzyme